MPPELRDPAFLADMLDASQAVVRFVQGKTFENFLNDELLLAGVERKIGIIGEAAQGVSDSLKSAHPEIPWRKIIAQRHVLVHDYGEIMEDRIWEVATVFIPALIGMLQQLLPAPPSNK